MNWIQQVFSRRRLYRDLSDEIREHLDEKIEALVESGLSREEASGVARREFGNLTLIAERGREVWQWPSLESWIQDARHSLRIMRQNSAFTTVAILTLALGIGANTAIFSLLDALLLRDLPVPHPEQLVRVGAHIPGDSFAGLSLPMFQDIARTQKVFSGMFAWFSDVVLNVEANGGISRADIWAADESFYSQLGALPQIGRLLTAQDVNITAAVPARVAVLSYGFWQRHYGGTPNVIGQTVKIEGTPFTVIGVTREGFTGISAQLGPEVTIPVTAEPLLFGQSDIQKSLRRPDSLWLEAAGRLEPGITFAQARAQLESIWPAIRQALTPTGRTALELSHFHSLELKIESGEKGGSFLRSLFSKPLYILSAIAGMVLLVACVNLASLMLARAASRSHELGVRAALGASRARLARQMLTESVLLSIAGGLAGFAFAWWGSRALAHFILGQIFIVPVELNLSPDWRILSFTAAAAILTGLLFGLAPAWRATREDPHRAVQQSARTLASGTGALGKGLIVAQIALSLLLLAAAGLFIRSLQKLHAVDPGFRKRGVLEASLVPKPGGYKNLDRVSYYRQLNDRVSRLPGVASAAFLHTSLGNILEWTEKVRSSATNSDGVIADLAMVMPGAFSVMGINLLRGRSCDWHDTSQSAPIAVVSENFAARWFPKGDAIGRQIDITTEPKWHNLTIVGVVTNASLYDIRKHQPPTVYLATTQYGDSMGYPTLLIQTNISPAAMLLALRQTVESLGHEYVYSVKAVETQIDRSLLQERITALLSAFFGGLALLLAGIGLYGLIAYNIARRSREIGIRMAVGATRHAVQWMVLHETLALAVYGLVIGLPCAVVALRFLASVLYGVGANDPLALIAVSFLLLAVAAISASIPARRAMRLDPLTALRHD